MNVNIFTKNYDIISSGSVVLQMGEYLEFQIENLNFRIEFIDEPSGEGSAQAGRVSTEIVNSGSPDAYFRIALYNQSNAYFSSTPDFLNAAVFDGKPLKLKFSTQSINSRDGSSDQIFFYTWYLGRETAIQTMDNSPQ